MKLNEFIAEDGRIVPGVNTTVDVKPGETERQAKKFFGGNGKPKHLGVPGATPNQAFNMGMVSENMSHTAKKVRDTERKKNVKPGTEEWFKLWFSLPYLKESVELVEGYKLKLERDDDMYILHIIDTETGKRTEVRGKSGYESGNYDPEDPLHQLLDKIGKASNISELINGEPVGINPKHPDGADAKKATDKAFNENNPGSLAHKINWGGQNKQQPPKKAKPQDAKTSWWQNLRKRVMGEDKDYMRGHCHTWALDDIKKNPERVLFARIGWHQEEEYEEVDHIFTVDPGTGKAYDVRGEFASIEDLLKDYDYGADEVDVQQISKDDIDHFCSIGELKPLDEKWSKKYKRSINCNNPKGFSQKAHCAGRKKNENIEENFADGKVKGKSRPGRVKRAGASCNGSVTELRRKAKKYSGERGKMYHWCANMKAGKKK